MKYWVINGQLIKGYELPSALHKFAQGEKDDFPIDTYLKIKVVRINKTDFIKRGGKI